MRPLTPDEKALSAAARKKANKQLAEQRKLLQLKLKMLPMGLPQRPILLNKLNAIKDVKGTPVHAMLDGIEIFIDYDLYRGFIRKLKNRQFTIKIILSSGNPVIRITHYASFYSRNCGTIELYSLPAYQTELLKELPFIDLD